MEDVPRRRREVGEKDVEIACKEAKWWEDRSWPRLLRVLGKKHKSVYLVRDEQKIKTEVERYGKYHGSFDFAAYLANESDQEISSPSPPPSKDKGSATNAPAHNDDHSESQVEQDLAGLSDSALISDPDEPPVTNMMHFDPAPAPDAFTQREIFRQAGGCPWKPVSVWSSAKKSHVPLICREGFSEYSWISKNAADKLNADFEFDQDQYAPSESIGKVFFESSGLVQVHCQPYNCVAMFTARFNVTDHHLAPDVLIGKDLMTKVTKMREKGLSYDESQATGTESRPISQYWELPPSTDDSGFVDGSLVGAVPEKSPRDTISRLDEEHVAEQTLNERSPLVPMSHPPRKQRTLEISNRKLAFSIAVFVTVITLGLDVTSLFVARINDPHRDVYLGSGISFLFKSAQESLPNLHLTSLTILIEITAVLLGGSWWYRSDLNFFRRPRHS